MFGKPEKIIERVVNGFDMGPARLEQVRRRLTLRHSMNAVSKRSMAAAELSIQITMFYPRQEASEMAQAGWHNDVELGFGMRLCACYGKL